MYTTFTELPLDILEPILLYNPAAWPRVCKLTNHIVRSSLFRAKYVAFQNGKFGWLVNHRFLTLEFLEILHRLARPSTFANLYPTLMQHCVSSTTMAQVIFLLNHMPPTFEPSRFPKLCLTLNYWDTVAPELSVELAERDLLRDADIKAVIILWGNHMRDVRASTEGTNDPALRDRQLRCEHCFLRFLSHPRVAAVAITSDIAPVIQAFRDLPKQGICISIFELPFLFTRVAQPWSLGSSRRDLLRWYKLGAHDLICAIAGINSAMFIEIFGTLIGHGFSLSKLEECNVLDLCVKCYTPHVATTEYITLCLLRSANHNYLPVVPYKVYLLAFAHVVAAHNILVIAHWLPVLNSAAYHGWTELISYFLNSHAEQVTTRHICSMLAHAIAGGSSKVTRTVVSLSHVDPFAGTRDETVVRMDTDVGKACLDMIEFHPEGDIKLFICGESRRIERWEEPVRIVLAAAMDRGRERGNMLLGCLAKGSVTIVDIWKERGEG